MRAWHEIATARIMMTCSRIPRATKIPRASFERVRRRNFRAQTREIRRRRRRRALGRFHRRRRPYQVCRHPSTKPCPHTRVAASGTHRATSAAIICRRRVHPAMADQEVRARRAVDDHQRNPVANRDRKENHSLTSNAFAARARLCSVTGLIGLRCARQLPNTVLLLRCAR